MIDVKAEARHIAEHFIIGDHPNYGLREYAISSCIEEMEKLAARVQADAIAPYKDAIAAHDAKMERLPTYDRPKTPAAGLRVLANWFVAMYPDDKNTTLQDDLRRWANEWDNVRADATREAMEKACRAVRERCPACDNGVAGIDGHGDPYECEYCGRPIVAIRSAFAAAKPAGPTIEHEARETLRREDMPTGSAEPSAREQFDKAAMRDKFNVLRISGEPCGEGATP